MQMLYSPSMNGFYSVEVHGDAMPADAREVDAQTYARFAGQAVTPDGDGMPSTPPVPPPAAPTSVTMRQARLALLQAGHLAAVELAIASMPLPDSAVARIEWDYAATVERASPLLSSMAQALGMDSDELDQLFMLAATL